MSRLLENAALLDADRARDLAANDALLNMQPRVLRAFAVTIKAGKSIRAQFEAFGFDSCSVTMQHADLAAAGEYVMVRALEAA